MNVMKDVLQYRKQVSLAEEGLKMEWKKEDTQRAKGLVSDLHNDTATLFFSCLFSLFCLPEKEEKEEKICFFL